MREIEGNILTITKVGEETVVAKCFTSNGMVTKEGKAVMGAGVAKAFRDAYIGIDKELGSRLMAEESNKVRRLGLFKTMQYPLTEIIAFPTKLDWKKNSSYDLIEKSARELADIITISPDLQRGIVLLPRPGCQNGKLDWNVVKTYIEDILPDNVVIVSLPEIE